MPPLASVGMYTKEFCELELCRQHLEPGGIVSQWVALHFFTLDDVKILFRTFAESLPY